ncbi:MAG: MBL fold metallo-hydrolase [Ignavibacteria bacterium]|nr:MBL fold metallo-hydrolase [Ignavibacteria bacterium]
MDVTVTFLGAASEVTGSKYLLQIGDFRLLVDCGLFQGRKKLRELNWSVFSVEPSSINAVLITHAHLDHTGYLPRLFRNGFEGPVYCTTATADLMKLILLDSAKIQVEEADYAKKKGYSKHEDPQPLYTPEDVLKIEENVTSTLFDTQVKITPNISVRFRNAGHILGAAIAELTIKGDQQEKKIVFSGDLGRQNDPILFPPHIIEEADVLFVESTYGDKKITTTDREDVIYIMNETFKKGGNIVMPAFSIGRTQTLLMYLKNVLMSGEIPRIIIAVDSPMAITATAFYRKYQDYHKLRGLDLDEDESFMTLRKLLTVARTSEESRRINEIKHNAIILAASGMMTGGRVLHHLANRLPDPKNAVIICGYQSEGSRGRRLLDGEKSVRIHGSDVPVRARVYNVKGLSAHADRGELLHWLNGFRRPPMQTFIVHGEPVSSQALADTLVEKGWNVTVPEYLQTFALFKQI